MLSGQFAQSLQKSSRRQHRPHFPATGSTITAAISARFRFEHFLDHIRIVVRKRNRGTAVLLLDTGAVGQTKSGNARSGLDQQTIHMPVITAIKLDNLAAPGKCARQADRAHGRFGAGIHQPHLLDRRDGIGDHFRDDYFVFGRSAEAGAQYNLTAKSGLHLAGDNGRESGAPGTQIIDIGHRHPHR